MRQSILAFAARSYWRPTASFHPLPVQIPLQRHIHSDNGVPSSIAKILEWKPEGKVQGVAVNGYIRSVRSMKSRTFVALGDGSSLAPLQALVPLDQVEGLAIGAAVRLVGSWVPSPGGGQSHELHVDTAQVLGPSDAKTFPIQKKYQTTEYLRTMPHIRPRTPFNSTLLRFRSEAISTLTQFFATRDFVQTHPPVITSSDCEGAGEVFTVTPAEKKIQKDGTEESFFRAPKYLTVSTQLHLEALAQAVGNVWTLAPTFRAEKSDTSRHLSEFYMLEAEMSFTDELNDVMDLVEDMLRYLSTNLYESRVVRDLRAPSINKVSSDSSSDRAPPKEVDERWQGLMQPSWPRLTYTEAIKVLQEEGHLFENKPFWGASLQSEHEKYIARVVGKGKPVFVTDYPRVQKAFYMSPSAGQHLQQSVGDVSSVDEAKETVGCFDLLVPEYCEIAGGSMREYRLPQLLDAMKRCGMVIPTLEGGTQPGEDSTASSAGSLDWYVDLRRWGCPPHGGFGLGFDRLLGYLSGVQSIRDTVTFPRWYGRCDC